MFFFVGALLVERPATVEEGFSQQAPLVFHMGSVKLQSNLTLYNMLVSRMAEVVQERMQANKKGIVFMILLYECYHIHSSVYCKHPPYSEFL